MKARRNQMSPQQVPTTAQPAATPASLRTQIEAVQVSLNDALARRAGVIARIDAAGGPSERARLRNGELRGVDGQISRFEAQLAGLNAELAQREAFAASTAPAPAPAPVLPQPVAPTTTTTTTTTVPSSTGIDPNIVFGGIATVLVLVPLFIAMAWRAGRRAAHAARLPAWDELGARLARMEEGIDAIASDVGRVEESQRFLTNALVADEMQTPAREKLGTRI
jgi:hypothetical protein